MWLGGLSGSWPEIKNESLLWLKAKGYCTHRDSEKRASSCPFPYFCCSPISPELDHHIWFLLDWKNIYSERKECYKDGNCQLFTQSSDANLVNVSFKVEQWVHNIVRPKSLNAPVDGDRCTVGTVWIQHPPIHRSVLFKTLLTDLSVFAISASASFLSVNALHCAANTNLVVSWFPGLMILSELQVSWHANSWSL